VAIQGLGIKKWNLYILIHNSPSQFSTIMNNFITTIFRNCVWECRDFYVTTNLSLFMQHAIKNDTGTKALRPLISGTRQKGRVSTGQLAYSSGIQTGVCVPPDIFSQLCSLEVVGA
jgi:hypothetical protein